VAVVVVGVSVVVDEVPAADHLRTRTEASAEVGVVMVDASVDDHDDDARPVTRDPSTPRRADARTLGEQGAHLMIEAHGETQLRARAVPVEVVEREPLST
jgi:hypothetical protein